MLALTRPRSRGPLVASVLSLGLLAPLAHADTLTVGPDLEVYDFDSITQAVNLASPGDTILVAPGDYPGFQVTGKPLTILGSGSGQTRLTSKFVSAFSRRGPCAFRP